MSFSTTLSDSWAGAAIFAASIAIYRQIAAGHARRRRFNAQQAALAQELLQSLTDTSNSKGDNSDANSNHQSAMHALRRRAVASFQPRAFDPIGGVLTTNAHFQTIVGSGALWSKLVAPKRTFTCERETWSTPDGDFFTVDFVVENRQSDDIVILMHGLESSAESPIVTKMCKSMLAAQFACVIVSFRGCSGSPNLTTTSYHVGFTADLQLVVTTLHERFPSKHIYICGFSLGGNVTMKFLGELGEDAWRLGVRGAAVTCVPFDPVESHKNIEEGFNRVVYSGNFLATLKQKAEILIQRHPGAFDIEAVRACKSLGEFDDKYIARVYNYRDKIDYYRSNGSKWFLHSVRVPAIAFNALDDPIVGEVGLPTASDVGPDAPVRLIYHKLGGHCGFMLDRWTLLQYDSDWMSNELARILVNFRNFYAVNM